MENTRTQWREHLQLCTFLHRLAPRLGVAQLLIMVGSCCWHHQTCCEDRLSASQFFFLFLHLSDLSSFQWPSHAFTMDPRTSSEVRPWLFWHPWWKEMQVPDTQYIPALWLNMVLQCFACDWFNAGLGPLCSLNLQKLLLWNGTCFQESFPAAKLS